MGLLAFALLAIGPIEELARMLHGGQDLLILLSPVSALPIAAALIVGIWVWRLILTRRLHREAVQGSKDRSELL